MTCTHPALSRQFLPSAVWCRECGAIGIEGRQWLTWIAPESARVGFDGAPLFDSTVGHDNAPGQSTASAALANALLDRGFSVPPGVAAERWNALMGASYNCPRTHAALNYIAAGRTEISALVEAVLALSEDRAQLIKNAIRMAENSTFPAHWVMPR